MASRLEVKMRAALADGSFYEAAELCKALASRAAAKKDTDGAAELLADGAAAQIAAGAAAGGVQRGVELASQMVAALRSAKAPADAKNLGRVLAVLRACSRERCDTQGGSAVGALGLSPDAAAVARWMGEAIQWAHAADAGGDGAGAGAAGALHDALALYLWDVAGPPALAVAGAHFARGADVAACALVLAAAASSEPAAAAEADLFVLRAALLYCAAGQRGAAAALPAAFAAAPGAPPLPPAGTPLTHFLSLFLEALQHDSPSLATALRGRYERALARDPALEEALDRAEAARWPEAYPAGGGGGLFGSGGLGALLAQLAA